MEMLHNTRLARRGLLKARGYACAAVLTLALVVSANATMFSAVYAVLLRPLPIRAPEELVIGWGSDQAQRLAVVELSYRNFEDWPVLTRLDVCPHNVCSCQVSTPVPSIAS